MPHYEHIVLTHNHGVATLTLNRPDKRNALNATMMSEIIAALATEANSSCGILVITGAGEAFCAGMDLEHLQTLASRTAEEHHADATQIAQLMRTLYDFPKPTIAAVNGAAIAGGAGIATICDFTLAIPEAKFGFTEVRIGFVPAIVSAFLLTQVGEKRARDLLLTGRLFKAQEAFNIGLLTRLVEHGDLLEEAHRLARTMLGNSPESMRQTKRLLSEFARTRLDAEVQIGLKANADVRAHADFLEGVSAFLEKRTPEWPSRAAAKRH